VVARGTGTSAAIPGITVAGKTGTATNPAGRSHAWFVAFAPAEAPRVAVSIVVENVGYGATYAAPIARRVLRVALGRSRS
ncbi:MAG TPA: penicillin-binding transpeptidase domain-containing protein, partial [Candidatus Baltobacteraceae bacterium]